MPPVRRTTGRATRRRRRPNYRDQLCVALLQISKDNQAAGANATIAFMEVRERIQANADAYGGKIIGPRMKPCVGKEIRALDNRGIIDSDFESETLQITPAGRRKFEAIGADADGAVTDDPSEAATLAALFDASRVRMGPGQMGRALDEKDRMIDELRDRLRRRDQGKLDRTPRRNGSLQLTTPMPTPGSFIRALPPDVVRRVDELQLLRVNHPAGPAESNAPVRTPLRLSGAKSMPYPSPESLPRRQGVYAAPVSPPPSPSPGARSRGASPMDVDDDDAEEVLVALSLVPTPSTSARIYTPRRTNDAEVQCDPSETETQLGAVRAELLEAQANYAQALETIAELEAQIRTLSSQQQTWKEKEAELEEAKNKAEKARQLWSENAARLLAEINKGF